MIKLIVGGTTWRCPSVLMDAFMQKELAIDKQIPPHDRTDTSGIVNVLYCIHVSMVSHPFRAIGSVLLISILIYLPN